MMKHGTDRDRHTDYDRETIRRFHKLWHNSLDGTWHKTSWLDVRAIKCPFDLWIYQELICKIRPALILETGTCYGGSALFMATICHSIGYGKVVTIDIKKPFSSIKHSRLKYLTGDSVKSTTLRQIEQYVQAAKGGPIMVILDSNHKKHHVLKELESYHKFVTIGSYLIVEDTNLNGDVRKDHGPGPHEALKTWLPNHPEFQIDSGCEKFYMTFNPNGYLQRVR